eukprot:TRINITY_DN1504_c0_g1_i2.p1 TRINITY_DN1504_c0_g1~~TRINITY_DN1504_c0_g1_i2.p1  ORF type:complete len:120 (+),score=12.58 TRINITY_DN1504_c0_g1_i2:115-474(+)
MLSRFFQRNNLLLSRSSLSVFRARAAGDLTETQLRQGVVPQVDAAGDWKGEIPEEIEIHQRMTPDITTFYWGPPIAMAGALYCFYMFVKNYIQPDKVPATPKDLPYENLIPGHKGYKDQ